jgi:hypothetical protein
LAEEFIRGNMLERSNPFFWDKLILNLPGSDDFDPRRPKVMKWDTLNKWLACDLVVFVDDLRATGPTVELTWALSHTVSARIQYLGIQEASRKRRPPTRSPGAWAGGAFHTSSTNVHMSISQEKWDKGKLLVGSLWDVIASTGADLDTKELGLSSSIIKH